LIFRKKILYVYIIFAILAAIIQVDVKPVSSQALARLSIEPAIVYREPGETLRVNVTVTGAKFLFAWQANISFNPDVLEFVNVTEGDFLARQPEGTYGAQTVRARSVLFGWATKGEYVGESGSGILATMEFDVLAEGESVLKFNTEPYQITPEGPFISPTILTAQNSPNPPPDFDDIEFTAHNGVLVNTVAPPVADFTYSPKPPAINESVAFDASASSADAPLMISEYYWDFGDGMNATVDVPTINHTFTTGGTFTVSLTIVDDAIAPPEVQSEFNTTSMPWSWYESLGTKTETIIVAFGHDVVVTNVAVSETKVTAGEIVLVSVTVLNAGSETESFDVTVYYGTHGDSTQPVSSLTVGSETTLTFNWDTTGVAEGDYQISARASTVEGEVDTQDNYKIDGTVTVEVTTQEFPTMLVVGGVIGLVIVVVVVYVFIRRRG
jgi:PKD repeat protein